MSDVDRDIIRAAKESWDPNEDAQAAVTGTIAGIELVNFMCHKFLKISMGPKLNFIIGHNGSGKSAILTGLMVCLGGKATVTNRGTSIREFIKEGEEVGSVAVTLRNNGRDAYQPDVYGARITIERSIHPTSTSYKIKSAADKTISTKKEDLLSILDHMQIQPANPMTILTQDTARSFLKDAKPSEMYQHFLRGTQLQQLSADYLLVADDIEKTTRMLSGRREAVEGIQRDLEELQRKWENLERGRDLKNAMDAVLGEIQWCGVLEREDEKAKKTKEVEDSKRKLESAGEKVADSESRVKALEEELATLRTRLESNTDSTTPLRTQISQLVSEMSDVRVQINDLVSEEREMRNTMTMHQRNVDEFTKKMEEEMRRMRDAGRMTVEERRKLIEDKEAQCTAVETRLKSVDQDMHALEEAHMPLTRRRDDWNNRRDDLIREVRGCESRVRDARTQQGNDQLSAYGPRYAQAQRTIDEYTRQRRWRGRPPIGPLGQHIKLVREEFAQTIESLLNGLIPAYLVETQEDLNLLKGVLNSSGCQRSQVIKYQSQRRVDFGSGEPDERLMTVRRAVQVDNEAVLGQLVVNARIEQMVLVKTRREGDELTRGGYPRNVGGVYTMDCFVMGSRSGGLSTSTMSVYRGAPRISKDVSGFVRREEEALEALKGQLRELDEEQRLLKEEMGKLQQKNLECKRVKERLVDTLQGLREEVRRMKDDMSEEEGVSLESLRETRMHEEEKVGAVRAQLEAVGGRKAEMEKMARELAGQKLKLEKEVAVILTREEGMKAEIAKLTGRVQDEVHAREHYDRGRLRYEQRILDGLQEIKELDQQIAQMSEACASVCARPAKIRNRDVLERKLREMETQLREIQNQHGVMEDVERALSEKRQAYENARKGLRQIEALIRELRESLLERQKGWVDFRHFISGRTVQLFREKMGTRGYRGVLDLDHSKGQLMVSGSKETAANETQSEQTRDARAMSGGEKSFATICLLLALWETMGGPVRILDEFDVFMDAVNRRMAINLILENARRRGCQYVFITPLALEHVEVGGDVRVQRLRDPERGQATLGYS
ncbi:P-loop containing nucleoside triphosphate hydrolase protein [Gaertneriomyces semiglobifer]|nr:P-loop containing nucleoside triphosphate hydrolase protein [Gaertneriomyces semiglobifer]